MRKLFVGLFFCLVCTGLAAGETGGGFARPFWTGAAAATVVFGIAGMVAGFLLFRRMRRSEHASEYLKMLSGTLPCLIFIRELGGRARYLFCNRDLAALFGLTPEELIGRSDDGLFGKALRLGRIRFLDRTAFGVAGGRSVTLEIEDGTLPHGKRWLRCVCRLVRGSHGRRLLVGVATDVTELELARRKLAESEHFQKTILDNIPIGLLLKDASDNYRYRIWNRALEKITGIRQEKVIGLTDQEAQLFPGCAERFMAEDRRVVDCGAENICREELPSLDGGKFVCRTTKLPFSEEGGRTFLLGMVSDVSRESKLEEKQRSLIFRMRELIRNERLVNGCLRVISLENDFDQTVEAVLRRIGVSRNSDRCFVFRFEDGHVIPGSGREWVHRGVRSLLPALKNLSEKQVAEVIQRLDTEEEIVLDRCGGSTFPADLIACCGNPDDKGSLLLCGVRNGERLWGVIGIDFVQTSRKISEADRETLRSIGQLLLLAEKRRKRLDLIADGNAIRRQLVENISIPLAIIDRDRRIITANRASAALSGHSPEELVGMPCHEGLCRSEDACPDYCRFDRVRSSGTAETSEAKHGDRIFRLTCQPIYNRNGELTGIFESAVDLTELRKQQRALTEAVERAEAADRAKSLFLAMMSHELRTPLNAVIGFSELLQDSGLPVEQRREYLQSINFSGRVLLSQINDLLDLTKLEAGQMKLQPDDTDLAALVRELYSMFRQKAEAKNLQFVVDCPPGMPLLRLDETRVRQILLNLLGNALKFTERGEITLTIRFVRPEMGKNVKLSIAVADTGSGISEEYMGKIFQPFAQDDSVRGANAMQGTGLGLAIARLWAERMGGVLTLESTLGKGSTFTLVLPEVPVAEGKAAEPVPVKPEKTLEPEPLPHCSVLLIDDVRMNLKVLEAMMKRLGCSCRSAESGEEALRMLDDSMPDWVFTDLWMPGMNGVEMARKLRKRPDAKNLKIAIVTADVGADEDFGVGEADAVLIKPVTLDKVRRLFDFPVGKSDAKPPIIA